MSFTQSSIYKIELLDSSGNLLADLSTYATQRHFVITRNRAETVDLTFDQGQIETLCSTLGTTVRNLFQPGAHDIRITRDTRALLLARINYLAVSVDERQRSISLRAVGYLDLFKDRYLWPTYTLTFSSTDLSQIAWSFINQSQTSGSNGSFGVTQGSLATSFTYTYTWQPYAKTIEDELIALTQLYGGIDFEFTPSKVFNTYYPAMGVTHTDIAFTYPGNIKRMSLPIDATQIDNYAIMRGSGNGSAQVVETRSDTNSQLIYQRREQITDESSINVAATLDKFGDEQLRMYANPTLIPDITLDGNKQPYLGSYWIGDFVPFRISAGSAFSDLNGQTLRINQIDVTIDENDSEEITLKVGYA